MATFLCVTVKTMASNKASIDAVDSTVHLHWSGNADLDFMVLLKEGAQYHLISFANEGSTEREPFVQLLSDFAFEELPTGNQEIIRICADKITEIEKLWFFCWDFSSVESASVASFDEYETHLELRQGDRRIHTDILTPEHGEGNAVCLAVWEIGEADSQFEQLNQVLTVPLFEEMSQVCAYVSNWVQNH